MLKLLGTLLSWWFCGVVIAAILEGAGWGYNRLLSVANGSMNPVLAIATFSGDAALFGYFSWFFVVTGRRTVARLRGRHERSTDDGEPDQSTYERPE
jgi:hypothetical protein